MLKLQTSASGLTRVTTRKSFHNIHILLKMPKIWINIKCPRGNSDILRKKWLVAPSHH